MRTNRSPSMKFKGGTSCVLFLLCFYINLNNVWTDSVPVHNMSNKERHELKLVCIFINF